MPRTLARRMRAEMFRVGLMLAMLAVIVASCNGGGRHAGW